jgi:membrane protein required for colicin V production
MPITLLDIIVLAVMLLSGLLAMIRGFMREILSIAAWATAAGATLYGFPRLLPHAKGYFQNDTIATIAVVAGVFLGTLVVATVITSKISDMVLDSRIGALDRTLGFMFGLGRGLLILVVAFIFFDWLVNEKQQPDWVRTAKSLSVLKTTGEWLKGQLPDDPEGLYQKYKSRRDEQTDLSPAQPPNAAVATDSGGYSKNQRDGLRQLIEGKATTGR